MIRLCIFILLILFPLIINAGNIRSLRQVDEKSAPSISAPSFESFTPAKTLTDKEKQEIERAGKIAEGILSRFGLNFNSDPPKETLTTTVAPTSLPDTQFQSDFESLIAEAAASGTPGLDIQGLTSGQIPGLAPIPVPGFPGPQDIPTVPGVNTIPGLSNFNYIVGQLVPQMIPPTNTLLGSSISRLLPKDATKNLAKDVFRAVHPAAENVEVARMMGRWFQVINSPHVIREACTVSHFGALTNNTYSATFTILKFYREGNPNGPPRFSLGYGFKSGETGQFLLHSSNSPDAEPFWVIKLGPLNEYNQYDYAVVSTWVRFPVFVIARDPERFQKQHMKGVLQFLEDNNYINVMTKAFNMISPVDYSQCQYTPTFSGAGK
uniref:Lipocalin/cytosolic fatty-acid binding domain-containing protein n=1 Tax=Strongyloides stercoralis TaxID=6248 RepID=A0A0K0E5T3_STRER